MITLYHYERMKRIELTTLFMKNINKETNHHEILNKSRIKEIITNNLFYFNSHTSMRECFSNLKDWRLRCKQIIDNCLKSLGKHKVYFEKPLDPKIAPKPNKDG